MENTVKNVTFSVYHLKMIALVTMFIDHIAAVLIWRIYTADFGITAGNQEVIYTIYEYMRLIGRMAFPIYCFLLVEGFLHTRSVKNYALRLLAFAFISEIPFDLALTGKWWSTSCSNVFFTLVIGLLLIWLVSYIEKFYEFWQEKQWDPFMGKLITILAGLVLVVVFGGFAEIVLKTDYGFAGVLAILILYLFRQARELGFLLAVLSLTAFSSSTEILALLMLYPVMKYDGTRGKDMKYIFYAFYPAHLLILGLICMVFGV